MESYNVYVNKLYIGWIVYIEKLVDPLDNENNPILQLFS